MMYYVNWRIGSSVITVTLLA